MMERHRIALVVASCVLLTLVHAQEGPGQSTQKEERPVDLLKAITPQRIPLDELTHIRSVAFSPDGSLLALGGWQSLVLWDVSTQKPRHTLVGHPKPVYALAFSNDGSQLVSVSHAEQGIARELRLWDVDTGEELRLLSVQGLHDLTFLSDGRLLALHEGSDKKLQYWDLSSADEPAGEALPISSGAINLDHLAVSPDERYVTFTSRKSFTTEHEHSGQVHLWDLQRGEEIHVITCSPNFVAFATLQPDGSAVATGTDAELDPSITLFDTHTGKALRTLQQPRRRLQLAAFSPDGRIFMTLDDDRLRFYDTATWDLLGNVPLEKSTEFLAFSHTGLIATNTRAVYNLDALVEAATHTPSSEPHVRPLIDALHGDDASARERAARLLGGSQDAAALLALPELIAALSDSDDSVRDSAARGLGDLGPGAADGVSRLAEMVTDDGHWRARMSAMRALGDIGEASAIPALIAGFQDSYVGLRSEAASAIGAIGPVAIPELVAVLVDKDSHARPALAALALEVMGPAAEAGIPVLIETLDQPPPFHGSMDDVSGAARRALVAIGPAALPALIEALEHSGKHRPWFAAATLGDMGPKAAQALPALKAALEKNPSHAQKRALQSAIERIEEP